MENLLTKIKQNIQLSTKAEDYLYTISKEISVKKGETLIKQGNQVNTVYYVKKGCLRSFCMDKNGKDHTLQFAIKDWWISDFIAIYGNELATLNIESLTASNLIQFNAKQLNDIHALFPEFESFQRLNLERHLVSLQKRILNQLQLTAKERYNLFLKQYPDIEQHTRNYHIASYLGITQESLSRIRVEKTKKQLS